MIDAYVTELQLTPVTARVPVGLNQPFVAIATFSDGQSRDVTKAAGLPWTGVVRFGQDYADTLAEWGRRFESAWEEIAQLGFDQRFRKLWRFYLSYCEAGFRTERTNVVQLSLARG